MRTVATRHADCGRRARAVARPGPDDFITIEVEADGFLYNMVRAIVGTLVQVGCGRRPESWPGEVLRAADRRVAGPTAPPQGLCLVRVEYEGREGKRGEARMFSPATCGRCGRHFWRNTNLR